MAFFSCLIVFFSYIWGRQVGHIHTTKLRQFLVDDGINGRNEKKHQKKLDQNVYFVFLSGY